MELPSEADNGSVPLLCIRCYSRVQEKNHQLICVGCGKSYPELDGIPCLFEEFLPQSYRTEQRLHAEFKRTYSIRNLEDIKPAVATQMELFYKFVLGRKQVQGNVLEVGGGEGWASVLIAKMFPSAHVYLTDISQEALSIGVEISRNEGAFLRGVCAAAAERLPYPEESFDMIFSIAFVHHLEEPERFFAEASRILKPGGKLLCLSENVFSVPIKIMAERGPLRGYCRVHGGKLNFASREDQGIHEKTLTLRDWKRFASRGHFSSIRFHPHMLPKGHRSWYHKIVDPFWEYFPPAITSRTIFGPILIEARK